MKLSPIKIATVAITLGSLLYLANKPASPVSSERFSLTKAVPARQAVDPLIKSVEAVVEAAPAVQTPKPPSRQQPLPFEVKAPAVVMETNELPTAPPSPARVPDLPSSSAPAVVPARASVPADEEYNGYAALELAQQMEGMERIQMVRRGMIQIASVNVARAVEAANSLTDGHDHGVAVGSLVRIINESNPALAANIAFSQVPPQTTLGLLQYPRTAVVMKQIMDTQISESPARTLQWANSLPDAASQVAARNLFASSWAEKSPEAALQWVQSLPASDRASIRSVIENASATPR